MKKVYQILMILMLLILMVGLVFGQDIVDTNQVTVEWEASTGFDDGLPFNSDDIIAYEIFRASYPFIGDRQDIISLENLGFTSTLQMTITFTVEGDFVIGVRTVRDVHGGGVFTHSNLIWSDIDGMPVPFVVRYYKVPASPASIKYL